ncbi:electron transport complex subunit RsxG [Pseudoalteromonas sp. MM17-2]|uniref:electron transport complex subunit RsxG n=1 Tax=Pseudoalteromonas sp. MM17-2 TaxID=2917753 RepID=UPI001EF45E7D|nr:electron transport complex subunit RsxG [Pseudoalteromonas sp. MM17-2]MCG7545854.1 electron transport complex subunit RsxG [Pseudoalteromonas sp. MM17-2]
MIISSMAKNGGILAAFALITTGAVTLVQQYTAPKIAIQEKKQLQGLLQQVLPTSQYDNDLYLDCTTVNTPQLGPREGYTVYRARRQGKVIALVLQSTAANGYSGNIDMISAVYPDGTVSGVRVTKHNETPGLGDKVETKRSDWIYSFANRQVQGADDERWAVKKDGGMFDQFTGATITPRAVVTTVKSTVLYAQKHFDTLATADNHCLAEEQS